MNQVKTNRAVCKSCGAEIKFVRTPAGKFMPCDPYLVSGEDIEGDTLVTEEGDVVKGRKAITEIVGRIPHWATCNKPELFRK